MANVVTTTFSADDSSFQAIAQRVKNAIMGIAGFKGNPFAALNTGAAGAANSIGFLTSAFRTLGPAIAAVTGVGSAFAAVVMSFKKATDIESTVFQIQNLAGGAAQAANAIQKINDTAQETATPFTEIGQKAKTLMEAGLSADQAADGVERLQKVAVMTGESFDDLADIYARLQLKQEVTIRDLNKLKAIPGIAEIAEQFKGLERATKDADRAAQQEAEHMRYRFQLESENMRFRYEQTEKQINATTELASKLGLAQQLFSKWSQGGRMTAVSGFGGLNEQTISQLETGIRQLQKETGLTESQLRDFAQSGKIGYQDLLQAATRFREEQQKAAELEMQQRQRAEEQRITEERYARQNKLLAEQRDLIGEVGQAIKRVTDPGGMFSNVTKLFETFGGKLKTMMYDIQNAFANFGMPLLDAMKPVLDLINNQMMPSLNQLAKNFGQWMAGEIKTVYDALSGNEAAAEKLKTQFGNALRSVFQTVSEYLFEQLQRVAIAFRDIIVDIFAGGNMRKILEGFLGVFVNVSEVIGKVIAAGIVSALAEAFKNVDFLGINKKLAEAADSMKQMVSPEELQKRIDVALKGFENIAAGVEGMGSKIIEDWGKEVKTLFPKATPEGAWSGFKVEPEMGGTAGEGAAAGAGGAAAAGFAGGAWEQHWGLKPGESLDLAKSGYGSMEAAQHSFEMGNDMSRLAGLAEEDNARTRAYYRGFIDINQLAFPGTGGVGLQSYLKRAEPGKTLTPDDFGFFRGKNAAEIRAESEKRGLGPQAGVNEQKAQTNILSSINGQVTDLNKNMSAVLKGG